MPRCLPPSRFSWEFVECAPDRASVRLSPEEGLRFESDAQWILEPFHRAIQGIRPLPEAVLE